MKNLERRMKNRSGGRQTAIPGEQTFVFAAIALPVPVAPAAEE